MVFGIACWGDENKKSKILIILKKRLRYASESTTASVGYASESTNAPTEYELQFLKLFYKSDNAYKFNNI